MDNRPKANFTGDPSHMLGRIFGPTLNNEYLVMNEIVSPDPSRWTAFYRYATAGDMARETLTRLEERITPGVNLQA